MWSATAPTRSASATEVPPNFWTTSFSADEPTAERSYQRRPARLAGLRSAAMDDPQRRYTIARAALVAAVLGGLLAGCSDDRAKASKETEPGTTATSESPGTTTASKAPVSPPAAPAGRTLTGDTPCPAA